MIVILYLSIFILPNLAGLVTSPAEDLFILFIVSIILQHSTYKKPTSFIKKQSPKKIKTIFLISSIIAFILIFKYSAIVKIILGEPYSAQLRENALKLAPLFTQVLVNSLRDCIFPFLIIHYYNRNEKKYLYASLAFFVFLCLFNLAKSFIIINTICLIYSMKYKFSIFDKKTILTIFFILFFLIFSGNLFGLYSNYSDLTIFLNDFIGRRILTLTPQLGVDARDFVDTNGFYWDFPKPKPAFEMLLYQHIGHSPLETGWANVYFIADAFSRGGKLAITFALILLFFYSLFFNYVKRNLGYSYSKYLISLFSIYIFMQGIFSFGLLISFIISPLLFLMITKIKV